MYLLPFHSESAIISLELDFYNNICLHIAPHYVDNVVNIRDGPTGKDAGGKLLFEKRRQPFPGSKLAADQWRIQKQGMKVNSYECPAL